MTAKFLAAALGALLAVLAPLSARAQACAADARRASLDFVIQDMNGAEVRLEDYRGQVILLDFWATWCAPCRVEMPWFVEFFERYGEQGFVVLAVDVDEPPEVIRPFAEQIGMDFPVLVGAGRDDLKDAYGPPVGYPAAFVIDRAGRICGSHTGFTSKDTFEREIAALL